MSGPSSPGLPSPGPPIELPARISKYELVEFLGGGMSHVFRARDTVLGRTVGIKILTPAGVADPDTKARFLQEARTASNISHENIMAVYDFGEESGKPYMVMEFLRGRTLRAAIQDKLLPDLMSKLRVAIQVARALQHVHRTHITHRDVKPENVNIDDTGHAKLMDFGIAKAADMSLTQPGYVLGTPYYMAPEQIIGKPVTPSVDIYAFGIMLYETLLGTRPYTGETIESIFYKIVHETLDLAPLAVAGVPPEVVAIVARCTKKDTAARYPDFSEVVTDLENAVGTQTMLRSAAKAPALKQTAKGARMLLFGGIGLAIAALAVALFLWSSHNKPPQPKPPETKPPTKKVEKPELPDRITTPTGVMRLVPGGPALLGVDKQSENVAAFYIDETEVSNQHYQEFCSAMPHALPPNFNSSHPQLPIVNIRIVDARAYAAWAGKRLPNAKEWEKAARGKDGFLFPWGDEKDPKHANLADNSTLRSHALQAVNAFPESASPYGALNMIGNALEFIDEPATPSAEQIKNFATLLYPGPTAGEPWVSIRGGSFSTSLYSKIIADPQSIPERFHFAEIGFRCVKNAE
jgi:serine/threonine protein kinase